MCRAEISYSKTIPAKFPFGQRSFLKATFFDHEKHLLISKSILRDDMPPVRDTSRSASPALQHAVSAGWKLGGTLRYWRAECSPLRGNMPLCFSGAEERTVTRHMLSALQHLSDVPCAHPGADTCVFTILQGADGSTRAFNSFAIKTADLEPGTCSLEVLDYFDMRGWFPV